MKKKAKLKLGLRKKISKEIKMNYLKIKKNFTTTLLQTRCQKLPSFPHCLKTTMKFQKLESNFSIIKNKNNPNYLISILVSKLKMV